MNNRKKVTIVAMILLCLNFSLFSQSISLKMTGVTVKKAMTELKDKTGYSFIYVADDMDTKKVVSVEANDLNTAIDQILRGQNVNYEIKGKNIVLSKGTDGSASGKKHSRVKVSGLVKDEKGEVIIGASVVESGTTNGTVTNVNGEFALDVADQANLVVSFIGYKNQTLKSNSQTLMTITMIEDTKQLDEVAVVGYGTMKKSDLTGSVGAVKAKDFNKGLVTSPSQLIQGRVTGVNIVNNGGEPGGGVTIRVRGSNSIRSGQDPLYVVDGVPLNVSDSQQPAGGNVSGVGSAGRKNPLSFLNPDDIESIDVLKDASATAIYGARGANGVIIVTTKKGSEGKSQVSYSGYGSVSWLPEQYDVLSADDYRAAAERYKYSIVDQNANTNWQDEIFRTSYSQNHNIAMSGGTSNGTYRASFAYQDQQGIIKNSDMQKYNGRFYITHLLLDDRLKIEVNTILSRTDDSRAPLGESGGHEGDLLLTALRLNPTFPIRNEKGEYFQYSTSNRNPVAMLDLTDDRSQTDRMLANFTATLDIVKNLKYKFNVAFDEMKASRKVEKKKELIYATDGGTVDINDVEAHNRLIENYFTYKLQLNETNRFDLLAGHSFQRTKDYSYGFSESGFLVNNIDYIYDLTLSTKKDQMSGRSNITINELQSFFGRFNYNLKDRYLMTINFRMDGSTKFGSNNKYGSFPSVAFAWRMSEEPMIQKLDLFDNLKLRLSWGQTGNQEIPNKISQMLLGSTGSGTIFGENTSTSVPSLTLTRTPNPDLKWEISEQINAGIDFGFFDNRLTGSIDYFDKVTKDVLLQIPSISPAPTATVWKNIEDMKIKNHGWEISLNGQIIESDDWQWDLGVNFSKVENMIENLPVESFTTATTSGPGSGQPVQVIRSGYPIGTFWGKRFLGFDENGKSKFKMDEAGKPVNEYLGSAQPDFTMNMNTTLRWKNLDLSLNMNGVFGNDVYNNLANVVDNRGFMSAGYNTTYRAVDSQEAIGNALDFSDRFIEDGSFLRLSNITLGYDVPFSANKWVRDVRVYVSANNVFCITNYSGYDPEVNAERITNGIPALGVGWTQYPMARSVSMGVNINF
ncbi:MAG: TonB-dependent receptor [Breznakibacter sp.]